MGEGYKGMYRITFLSFRVWRLELGRMYRDGTPIMESQMEKTIESCMEVDSLWWMRELGFPKFSGPFF